MNRSTLRPLCLEEARESEGLYDTIYLNIPAISISSTPKMLRIYQTPDRTNMCRNRGKKTVTALSYSLVTESAIWCLGTGL